AFDRSQCLGQHKVRDGVDQAELNGQTDERAGWMNLPFVIAPADERLESDDFLTADIHFRLEGAAEPAIADREAQPLFQLHPCGNRLPHMEIKVDRIPLGVAFGPVHRAVGVAAQFFVVQAMLWMDAHPDGSRGEDLKRFDMKWLFQVCQDLFDDRPDLVVVLDRIKKEQELVTADARQHVAVAKALCNAPGDLQEKRIADRVAVIVIDVLEVIQVDKSQRKPAVLVAKNPVDMFPNENAVWK